jgi:hypothetical protein
MGVFSIDIPTLELGASGMDYFGKGKFNVIIPLTDGTKITAYNPDKMCDCRKPYNVPLCFLLANKI